MRHEGMELQYETITLEHIPENEIGTWMAFAKLWNTVPDTGIKLDPLSLAWNPRDQFQLAVGMVSMLFRVCQETRYGENQFGAIELVQLTSLGKVCEMLDQIIQQEIVG